MAVYLDGMSRGLHGDPKTAQRDQLIRGMLEVDGYTVVVVQSRDLDDPQAVRQHLKNLAQAIGRTDLAEAVESGALPNQGERPQARTCRPHPARSAARRTSERPRRRWSTATSGAAAWSGRASTMTGRCRSSATSSRTTTGGSAPTPNWPGRTGVAVLLPERSEGWRRSSSRAGPCSSRPN